MLRSLVESLIPRVRRHNTFSTITLRSSSKASNTRNMASEDKKSILSWSDPKSGGEFKRQVSSFRDWIEKDPKAKFPAEKGRYHLCWRFAKDGEDIPGENVTPDPLHKENTHLRDIYFATEPGYEARFTVPTLYDTKQKTIVSNESSEIIRMFYHAFDDLLPEEYKNVDLLPKDLEAQIDETNEWTYNDINNGVYKSGFATTQEAYERNVRALFSSLDRAEAHLASSPGPYYHGDRVTEADIRLYTTIIRFDPVYVQHFKCNIRDIRSGYPALHKWVRHCYWNNSAFGSTTEFTHIRNHYTRSHQQINPFSITPVGPVPDILPIGEAVNAVKAVLK
nr:glutathione s-transferase omega-like 2 [Quercus suber]